MLNFHFYVVPQQLRVFHEPSDILAGSWCLNQRRVCHHCVRNKTVGKQQSITSLCLHLLLAFRPWSAPAISTVSPPPLLAKGLFWDELLLTVMRISQQAGQLRPPPSIFSHSCDKCGKKCEFTRQICGNHKKCGDLRLVCKNVKTASPKATPFSFGFV